MMIRRVCSLAFALSVLSGGQAALAANKPQVVIASLYRLFDEGVATKNAAAMLLPFSNGIVVTGPGHRILPLSQPADGAVDGRKREVYADLKKQAAFLARPTSDGYRVIDDSSTRIRSISVVGRTANVIQKQTFEWYIQDDAMNAVGAVWERTAQDSWSETSVGWRMVSSKILQDKATRHTFPVGLINSYHQQITNMKNFGDQVNQSNCMHAPAVANLGYAEQMAVCHR